jgi:hypothetical protein
MSYSKESRAKHSDNIFIDSFNKLCFHNANYQCNPTLTQEIEYAITTNEEAEQEYRQWELLNEKYFFIEAAFIRIRQ